MNSQTHALEWEGGKTQSECVVVEVVVVVVVVGRGWEVGVSGGREERVRQME